MSGLVAAGFTVDLEGLDRVVADLEACEHELELLDAELARQLGRLDETWAGLAATAQQAAHRQWSQGAAEMRDALADLRGAARRAHREYVQAVSANVAMWRRVS